MKNNHSLNDTEYMVNDTEYMEGYSEALDMLESGKSILYVQYCSDYPNFSFSFKNGFKKAIDNFILRNVHE
jgi:hypothetical protein